MAGLVVKPLSGTLDFFSLASEGIKNTTKNDDELELDKRLRQPRPFYELEQTIREYDEYHAFWINLIPRIRPDISVDFFFEVCMLEYTEDSWSILFLTLNSIAHIVADHSDPSSQAHNSSSSSPTNQTPVEIRWIYPTKDLRYVEILDDKLLAFGFEQCSHNLSLSDHFLA